MQVELTKFECEGLGCFTNAEFEVGVDWAVAVVNVVAVVQWVVAVDPCVAPMPPHGQKPSVLCTAHPRQARPEASLSA